MTTDRVRIGQSSCSDALILKSRMVLLQSGSHALFFTVANARYVAKRLVTVVLLSFALFLQPGPTLAADVSATGSQPSSSIFSSPSGSSFDSDTTSRGTISKAADNAFGVPFTSRAFQASVSYEAVYGTGVQGRRGAGGGGPPW